MLLYNGTRISEFLDLKKENVHLEEQYFDVIDSKTETSAFPAAAESPPLLRGGKIAEGNQGENIFQAPPVSRRLTAPSL